MGRNTEEIFSEARTLSGEARDAFLLGACGKDLALRGKVEALLAADAASEGFLETLAPGAPGEDAPTIETLGPAVSGGMASERAGQTIGRYKLLQPIGEGGFGTVWLAEQREPVKRRIALKIIKLGMDTKQVIARFEAERQALAMMEHPNIAKVLDAGATDVGRPYFVMEYVRGVSILEYCDTAKLDMAARIDLFILVCNAIQHAHQKGIIHRDIKPSNVLVTLHDGVPVPKVIDFGVAKATNTELTQKTLFTEHRQMIGTPAYMSPEQAELSGLDIDTRSDIYSLGVLLYEILTGTTPFDSHELVSRGFVEMMRIIREQEPQKPSTRLSTLGPAAFDTAERRQVDSRRLGVVLRGDLDWIIMKCLEKDRSRRYETANGLAADLRRHLAHEPVVAGPPSGAYRLRKFLDRNRAAVAGAAILFLVLAVGLSVAVAGLAQARQGERVAQAAQVQAEWAREDADNRRREAEAALQKYDEVRNVLPSTRCRLAVCPLEDASHDAEQSYLVTGITRSLIDDLGMHEWIDVTPYESVTRYADSPRDSADLAHDLHVQFLLRGSVERVGEEMRVTLSLEQPARQRRLWSETYTDDLAVLRGRLADDVMHQLLVDQGQEQQERRAKRDTTNPDAWEAYVAGMHNLQGADKSSVDRAIGFFEEALRLDAEYALAHLGVARANLFKATLGVRPEEYNEPARRAAQRAIGLDESLAGAHAVLGQIRLQYDWNWEGAFESLNTALTYEPDLAAAHAGLATYYVSLGEFDLSMEHLRTAVEADPAWLLFDESLVYTPFFARDMDVAIDFSRRALDLDENYWSPYAWMGLAQAWKGELKAGIESLEEAHRLEPESPIAIGLLASVYAMDGQVARAEAKLQELLDWTDFNYVCPYEIATVYLALGDTETAYRFLDMALHARSECMPFMAVDVRMDSEHGKAEFAELMRRVPHPLADRPRPWVESGSAREVPES